MLDAFIENETNMYFKEIYPFFIVQKRLHPKYKSGYGVSSFLEFDTEGGSLTHDEDYVSLGTIQKRHGPYYLIHYDTLTKMYVTMLHHLKQVQRPLNLLYCLGTTIGILDQYLGDVTVIAYQDFFLVEKEDVLLAYNLDKLRYHLERIVVEVNNYKLILCKDRADLFTLVEISSSKSILNITQKDADLFQELQMTVGHLTKYLSSSPMPEEYSKPLLLDKSVAQPYREMLFNKEQGFYNTQEKQKALFMEFLQALPSETRYQKRDVIIKYGCAHCGKEAHFADQIRLLPFCSEICSSACTTEMTSKLITKV